MNDLFPLRSSSRDAWELAVLRSARADVPPPAARARVAAALGVSAVLVASSSAAAAAGAGAGVLTGSSLAGWAGIGLAAGLVTSLAGHSLTQMSVERREAPVSAARSSVEPRARRPEPRAAETLVPFPESPRTEGAAEAPEVEAHPLAQGSFPVETPGGSAPRTTPSERELPVGSASESRPSGSANSYPEPSSAALPEASRLAQEVQALDEARRALESGDAPGALSALARYSARFGRGTLATEAAVLRVKARLASGDRAGAEREAEAILRAAPGSRYAERVRALLGRGEKE